MSKFWSIVWVAVLGTASMTLSGCAALQVKMGSKIYLNKTPVTSISVEPANLPGIGPGEKSSLVVKLTQPDGTVLQTEGAGKGKVLWQDLAVSATVVTANKKGVLSLVADPRISEGKLPHVIITVPGHPGLSAELDIPLRYDYKFTASVFGSSGFSGTNGSDGLSGMSGSTGSLDPNHPSAGGNGTDGGNGSDGSDGSRGGDGPSVQIHVTLRSGNHPLLQASVTAEGREQLFLVDPEGGTLAVSSDGGSGGSGGKGGRGGRGGSGGIGSPNGSSGSDGHSGRDGSSGSSGRGGSIKVTYDPQVKPYLSAFKLSNPGGPKPVFEETPVAPLW
jgi:hypothetical protein